MAKLTLIVEKNPLFSLIYSLNLNIYVGADVIRNHSIQDAVKSLQDNPQINLIIMRKDGKNKDIILSELSRSARKIPIILIGEQTEINQPELASIASGLDIKPIVKAAAKFLGVTAQDMVKLSVPDYFPFKCEFFHDLRRSNCELFLEEAGQYFEVVKPFTDFAPEFIKGLESKGIHHLYAHKNQRLKLVNHITAELVALINDSELNEDEAVVANEINRENLSQKLRIIGVNEETIELAKKSMKAINNTALKTPSLAKMLARMNKNKSGFLYLHTQLVSFVAMHIMDKVDWGSNEQTEKMSFICFFHDIALENDEQAKIQNKEELKKSKLSKEEKMLVDKHAQIAGELVHKFPRAPLGVDQIIKQHHGVLNGIGFSEHYGANLSPIAIVFILAEELTHVILRNDVTKVNMSDCIKTMREKFTTARFQKIIDLMENIPL